MISRSQKTITAKKTFRMFSGQRAACSSHSTMQLTFTSTCSADLHSSRAPASIRAYPPSMETTNSSTPASAMRRNRARSSSSRPGLRKPVIVLSNFSGSSSWATIPQTLIFFPPYLFEVILTKFQ